MVTKKRSKKQCFIIFFILYYAMKSIIPIYHPSLCEPTIPPAGEVTVTLECETGVPVRKE